VAAGFAHNVALKSDGSLLSWGNDTYGQVSDTPTGTNFVAVAAGNHHSIAVSSDGSLACWGVDDGGTQDYGQVTNAPNGTDFVGVGSARLHSIAIHSNGSLAAWGDDSYGQVSNTPSGTEFVAVAGGWWHSVAVKLLAVPQLINYQGRLNDSMGDALDGVSVDLTFRFYDAAMAGNPLFTVQQTGIQVSDGIFNVLIGSGTVTAGSESGFAEVFQKHGSVWMSTEVGNDGEMTPRQRIGSVPYALRAGDLSHYEPRGSAPENPVEGDVYWDSTAHKLMCFDGTTWQACW